MFQAQLSGEVLKIPVGTHLTREGACGLVAGAVASDCPKMRTFLKKYPHVPADLYQEP